MTNDTMYLSEWAGTSPEEESEAVLPEVFEIPVENLPWLQRKLDQMNKRAEKLGCPPVAMQETGRKQVPHRIDPSDPESAIVEYEYALVQVTGAAPVLPDWTLVAALQHVEGHALVRTAPEQVLPAKYRGAEPWCDHCSTHRQRQGTFVLRNADGRMVQIGRNCLRDFLTGGRGPEALAFWATFEQTVRAAAEEASEFDSSKQHWALHLDQYLSMTAACMRTHGWVSATLAKTDPDRLQSTSSEALHQLLDAKSMKAEYRVEVLPEDSERAKLAIEWAKLLPEFSAEDYLNNLGIIARLGVVPERMLGVAASMVAAYERAMGKERERKERKPSNHQGVIGQRGQWDLTIKGTREFPGFRDGVTILHLMEDAAGNQFKWFASAERMDEGKTYHVRGTVKAHEQYKGVNATMLTRCKAEEVKNG